MSYADSTTSQAIQIADLISGTRRRALEGDAHMQTLDNDFASLYPAALAGLRTHTKRRWTNRIVVFQSGFGVCNRGGKRLPSKPPDGSG